MHVEDATPSPDPLTVPELRVRRLNEAPLRDDGDYVLYWMIAFRRVRWNFALQRAAQHARTLGVPLLVFEPLRVGYQWASDRHHAFILQGMADNAAALADAPATYYPYVEPDHDADKGLLKALMARACAVVTDDYPAFFLPRMLAAVAKRAPVRLEAVDSNGVYPMAATDRVFTVAHSFRRHLQKTLRPHLEAFPQADPLKGLALPTLDGPPADIVQKWPMPSETLLSGSSEALSDLPIDHTVSPVSAKRGGSSAAQARWEAFVQERLEHYADARNEPDSEAATGLSPYLHFGHISAHQMFHDLTRREGWTSAQLNPKANGKRHGWWNMSEATEAFLDELLTWREIGFNRCALTDDYMDFSSLPAWAQETLANHAGDEREVVYTLEEFEQARTHDPVWNAAQRQLRREGVIHNYLRMLWGKKILHWSRTPQDALDTLIELNNKYALDGRDPNSYSGIFWVLGRYDRAWGPERPIFGKVRYMTSESTRRKLNLRRYLKKYA